VIVSPKNGNHGLIGKLFCTRNVGESSNAAIKGEAIIAVLCNFLEYKLYLNEIDETLNEIQNYNFIFDGQILHF
jgi:hypothetical protein